MLLYFKTKNNLSFDEEVEFNAVAGSYKDPATGKEQHAENLIVLPKYDVNLLRTSVIYGANASGKSNLIDCMIRGVYFVKNNHRDSGEDGKWMFNSKHNRLKFKNANLPLSYTYSFIVNNTMFEYTFAIDQSRVTFETLLEYRSQKPITHYKREYNKKTKSYDWAKFSIYFTGEKETVKNITNERSLFLSVGDISNLAVCKEAFSWFKNIVKWSISKEYPGRINEQFVLKNVMEDKKYKTFILEMLKEADFSIVDIDVKPGLNSQRLEVKTHHKAIDKSGKEVTVEMDYYTEESTGTRRFIAWWGVWIDAHRADLVIFLDEFGVSMHTLLTKYLLKKFTGRDLAKNNAQLIFSTHDTNLMSKELFRPDQIWVVDRDDLGNSKLQSLSKFKLSKVKDLEKGYLDGLYGGIPYLKD